MISVMSNPVFVFNPNYWATRIFDKKISTTRNWETWKIVITYMPFSRPVSSHFLFLNFYFPKRQWIQLFKLEKELSHDPFQICYDPLVGRDPSVEKRWSNLYRPCIQICTPVVLDLFLIGVILRMKKIWGTTKSRKM